MVELDRIRFTHPSVANELRLGQRAAPRQDDFSVPGFPSNKSLASLGVGSEACRAKQFDRFRHQLTGF